MKSQLFLLVLTLGLGLLPGCQKSEPAPQAQAAPPKTQSANETVVPPVAETKPADGQVRQAAGVQPAEPPADFLHQPMAEATTTEVAGQTLPPAKTIGGKSVGQAYLEVKRLWPTIRFRDPAGKPIEWTATIQTNRGVVELSFLPDLAPNHVRSFLALAKAGFYDGLRFETRIGDPADPQQPRAVAAASPEGDGNELAGAGYWLRPEILTDAEATKRNVKHLPGMVGAIHAYQQPNAACCRFYVCLTEAPQLDGSFTLFAKVTKGLEILEELHRQPVQPTPTPPPLFTQPLVIEKVTVAEKR